MAILLKKEEHHISHDIAVLCVGLTVVDMITIVETYPDEDSDQRGISFRKQRGGNASNNCTVLSQLSTPCEYLGVLPPPSDPEHRWLIDDFEHRGIKIDGCVLSDRPCPMATVIISHQTGTRTIVFCDNGQPELSHEQFIHAVGPRLAQFSWIHFEIRPNVEEYLHMLEIVRQHNFHQTKSEQQGDIMAGPTISVEIEKPDLPKHEQVMSLADVIFISKDWARGQGWTNMSTAVQSASQLCRPDSTVVCPWAEEGAAAFHEGESITTSSPAPDNVVDTLGAGDTFVAGFIHARLRGLTLQAALEFACRLATTKCTTAGFDELHKFTSQTM